MRNRCNRPKEGSYKYYGARGITYDPRWEDFKLFLEDMGERQEGTSLERINNEKNYCKENCCWATASEQAHNTRRTKLDAVKVKLIRGLWDAKNPAVLVMQWAEVVAPLFDVAPKTLLNVVYGHQWKTL